MQQNIAQQAVVFLWREHKFLIDSLLKKYYYARMLKNLYGKILITLKKTKKEIFIRGDFSSQALLT
jgi:hypothetical protein